MRSNAVRKGVCAAAVALLAAGVGAAPAAADGVGRAYGGAAAMDWREVIVKRGDRGPGVKRIQRRLRSNGIGVAIDGVFGRATERAVKRFQRRRGLDPDGVVGPITRAMLKLRKFSRASVRRRRKVRVPRVLRLIAQCESGGNPRAVSPGGTYRGKYQFARSTWRSLGGRGDPARAPEWKQDKLALKLYRREGLDPWPACSALVRD